MEKKEKSVKEQVKEVSGFYKGYDMRWLRENPDHPDYFLVKEYDEKGGEK